MAQQRLGALLVDMGLIDPVQLETALDEQTRSRRRLGKILVDASAISERRLVQALSRQLSIEVCEPMIAPIHERVRSMIPASVAHAHAVLPMALRKDPSGESLFVATADPLDKDAHDAIVAAIGPSLQLRWLLAGETELELAIARHYGSAPAGVRRAQPSDAAPSSSSPPSASTTPAVAAPTNVAVIRGRRLESEPRGALLSLEEPADAHAIELSQAIGDEEHEIEALGSTDLSPLDGDDESLPGGLARVDDAFENVNAPYSSALGFDPFSTTPVEPPVLPSDDEPPAVGGNGEESTLDRRDVDEPAFAPIALPGTRASIGDDIVAFEATPSPMSLVDRPTNERTGIVAGLHAAVPMARMADGLSLEVSSSGPSWADLLGPVEPSIPKDEEASAAAIIDDLGAAASAALAAERDVHALAPDSFDVSIEVFDPRGVASAANAAPIFPVAEDRDPAPTITEKVDSVDNLPDASDDALLADDAPPFDSDVHRISADANVADPEGLGDALASEKPDASRAACELRAVLIDFIRGVDQDEDTARMVLRAVAALVVSDDQPSDEVLSRVIARLHELPDDHGAV